MSSIDERIVEMKFNNGQFQNGVKQTTKSLDDLKKGLNLDGATKGLQELSSAGKNFSLAGMASGVENIASKFTALGVIGITALASIASKALSVGGSLIKSMTLDPITTGLQEYETQLNAVQTVLANTASKGTTLKQVNAALDELNTYSDKTIYNFTQMAKNIGTFTAAGVDLKTSTAAIKGIANLAAVSGANADQASSAMYQLSQALATGKVSLMDWNSVVNAGMGGQVFQDAIKATARVHGVAIDDIIKKEGSFRDSLQKGWLTSEILTETLSKFTGDLTASQLKTMGYNEKQITEILKMGKTAQDAATKVKTMSQLISTLQEASQSGWGQTWKIIFGDFDEAKVLFTNMSNVLGGMVSASANARNKLLGDWKKLGGRTAAIEAVSNIFNGLMDVLKPIREAFRDIFPPATGKQLYDITIAIRDFTRTLKIGADTSDKLKRTFKGVFAIFDIGFTIIQKVFGMIGRLFGAFSSGGGGVLDVTAKIGDFLVMVRDAIKKGDGLTTFFDKLGAVLTIPIMLLRGLGTVIGWVVDKLVSLGKGPGSDAVKSLGSRLRPIQAFGDILLKTFGSLGDILKKVFNFFAPLASKLGEMFKGLGTAVSNSFKDMNFDSILSFINTGLFAALTLAVKKFLKGGKIDIAGGLGDSLKNVFGGLTDTLSAMQAQLKAGTLLKIAGAIALLTVSVVALSMIDAGRLTAALTAMTVMFTQLFASMAIFEKISKSSGFLRMPVITGAMILLAIAIDLLAIAVAKLAKLDWNGLAKGLTGVAVLLGSLVATSKLMSKNAPGMLSASVGMIALAIAVKLLASAVTQMAGLSWGDLAKGLIGVGTVLASLAIFTKMASVNKGALAQSAGLVLLGVAVKILASAVSDFAAMDVGNLSKGLIAMALVLTQLAVFTKVAGAGATFILTAAGLVILGAAVKIIASALKDFATMSWDEIGRGLVSMAGALTLITAAALLIPPSLIFGATGMVVMAAALLIIGDAMKKFATLSWDDIGRAMVVLAGSLILLAAAALVMSGAVVGALAMIVIAGALAIMTPAILGMSKLSWDDIGRGLTMLAGVFGILALAGIVLTPVVPTLILLGVAIALLGVGTLAAGVGILAFSAALTAFSLAGAAGTATLVAMVSALLGLIPFAMQKIGEGVIEFAKVIQNGGPAITNALVTVLMSLLTAINTLSPKIIDTLFNLILKLVNTMAVNVPKFVDAGIRMITGILNGIANNMGKMADAGTRVITEFIRAVGRNAPKVIQAGVDALIDFVEGLAQGVRNNSRRMGEAGGDLAVALIEGMVNGIGAGVGRVIDAAANMAQNAFKAAMGALDAHSPSRKFHALGMWSDQGLANGLTDYSGLVSKASEGVANTALDSLSSAMGGISDTIGTDVDFNPTITPVLDLNAFKKDASAMSGILTPAPISVDQSIADAAYIDAQNRSAEAAKVDDTTTNTSSPKSVTFVQNNNSPKALSSSEIYRNTNNGLSKLKEELNA